MTGDTRSLVTCALNSHFVSANKVFIVESWRISEGTANVITHVPVPMPAMPRAMKQ